MGKRRSTQIRWTQQSPQELTLKTNGVLTPTPTARARRRKVDPFPWITCFWHCRRPRTRGISESELCSTSSMLATWDTWTIPRSRLDSRLSKYPHTTSTLRISSRFVTPTETAGLITMNSVATWTRRSSSSIASFRPLMSNTVAVFFPKSSGMRFLRN